MVNWEEYIPKGSDQWESQMVVFRMFDERPIWSEGSLTERLLDKGFSFSISMLRRFLSRISYYFSSGPFQRFWIKKGYDPRKDPDSRIYQRIIFEYQSHYKVTVMLTMPIRYSALLPWSKELKKLLLQGSSIFSGPNIAFLTCFYNKLFYYIYMLKLCILNNIHSILYWLHVIGFLVYHSA